MIAVALLLSMLPAHAIPPPPNRPPQLREARMTATVQLIEAKDGTVGKITERCRVSGKIPVYSDDGRSAFAHTQTIASCTMSMNGKKLPVKVKGAKAVSKKQATYAIASVHVTPLDAVPLCPDLCGPQPLADSDAEVRVSGKPKSIAFSLHPNLVSMMNAKPTLWLEANVEIVD